jgi:type I restriction enzyme S subunit
MRNLPRGWIATTLGEIVELRGERVSPRDFPEAPFVGLENVEPHTSRIINFDRAGKFKSGAVRFYPGDVLYSRLRPYLNKVFLADVEGLASAEFLVLQSSAAADPDFIRHRIMMDDFLSFTARLDRGDRPRVDFSQISAFKIELPPLAEQQRIARKLNELMSRTAVARAELNRIPALVSQYKNVLLGLAFSGALTRNWRKSNDRSSWKTITIEALASRIFDGPFGSHLKSSDYTKSGVRVIRLENIGHLEFIGQKEAFISVNKFKRLQNHSLEADDVLVSSFVSDEFRICLFPGLEFLPAINKADCFCIRTEREICDPHFLAFRLASQATYEDLKRSIHGATRPRISLKQLKAYSLELPPLTEQKEIVARLLSAFDWLEKIVSKQANALDGLLSLNRMTFAQAVRGELVPQDFNDEPISVLLEQVVNERKTRPKDRRSRSKPASEHQKRNVAMSKKGIDLDLDSWPENGLTFEEIRSRMSADYESVQVAIFELLGERNPSMVQHFDEKNRIMRIRKNER